MLIPVFRDPADTGPPNQTSYLFVSGAGTVFETGQKVDFSKITDGLSNTIMLVEVKSSQVGWAEPRDFDASQATSLPPGNHPSGNGVAMGDGSVRWLQGAPPQTIRAAATRNGGEPAALP
jgi:hypothetical protein